MSGIEQKIPFTQSLNLFSDKRIADAFQAYGQQFPCVVKAIEGSIVTVKFQMKPNDIITLPLVKMPVFGPEYIRYPIKVGDLGYAMSASVSLRNITGLGVGLAEYSNAGNLTSLVFMPVGNTKWSVVDPKAVTIYGENGVVLEDTKKQSVLTLLPNSITVSGKQTVTLVVGNTTIIINDNSVTTTTGATTIVVNNAGMTATNGSSIVNMTSASINLTSPLITLNGAIALNGPFVQHTNPLGTSGTLIGPLEVINDVTASGKSVATHKHDVIGIQTGGSTITTTSPD
jgi:hypothetical protein